MNDSKLNELLNEYQKTHSPEPSRALIDKIMRVPHEIEQTSGFSWKLSDWIVFLVPRLSGLTAALVMGIYMGGAGSSALAEDEIAEIDQGNIIVADLGSALSENSDALLDVEELIFVEE
ncbi:MAG: hypothetical protein H6912_06170 [Kordiimonadaceae bacterium]|nr:hypothetical protein [Kordiimonadaceae bacterium]